MKNKLMVNYDAGRSLNAVMTMMGRGSEIENKEMMKLILKLTDKSKLIDVLHDVTNPKLHHESALEKVCAKGDDDKFAMIKEIYTESKVDFEDELTRFDYKNESLLRRSIAAGMFDHCSNVKWIPLNLCFDPFTKAITQSPRRFFRR